MLATDGSGLWGVPPCSHFLPGALSPGPPGSESRSQRLLPTSTNCPAGDGDQVPAAPTVGSVSSQPHPCPATGGKVRLDQQKASSEPLEKWPLPSGVLQVRGGNKHLPRSPAQGPLRLPAWAGLLRPNLTSPQTGSLAGWKVTVDSDRM